MMLYWIALVLAVLLGLLHSRRPQALMLWDLRLVWLLPAGLLVGLIPFWLSTYRPDLIWTPGRQGLMAMQAIARGLILLFATVNFLFKLQTADWTRRARPATLTRLTGLLLAMIGLAGQITVLLTNQGYWPLSVRYLEFIDDPLLVEGIRNGALRLSRLIDDETRWAFLGQVIPFPSFNPLSPAKYQMVSVTDILLAAGLFLTVLSLFNRTQLITGQKIRRVTT